LPQTETPRNVDEIVGAPLVEEDEDPVEEEREILEVVPGIFLCRDPLDNFAGGRARVEPPVDDDLGGGGGGSTDKETSLIGTRAESTEEARSEDNSLAEPSDAVDNDSMLPEEESSPDDDVRPRDRFGFDKIDDPGERFGVAGFGRLS